MANFAWLGGFGHDVLVSGGPRPVVVCLTCPCAVRSRRLLWSLGAPLLQLCPRSVSVWCATPLHLGGPNALRRPPLPDHTPAAYGGGRSGLVGRLGPGTEVAPGGPSSSPQVPRNFFRLCTLVITFRPQCAACGLAGVGRCYITCYGGSGAAGGFRCPSGPRPVPTYRTTPGAVRGDFGPGGPGGWWWYMWVVLGGLAGGWCGLIGWLWGIGVPPCAEPIPLLSYGRWPGAA